MKNGQTAKIYLSKADTITSQKFSASGPILVAHNSHLSKLATLRPRDNDNTPHKLQHTMRLVTNRATRRPVCSPAGGCWLITN
jgi:hypothetical protein